MRLAYLGMLGFVVLGVLPLEIWPRIGVLRRWRRLLLTLLPVLVVFITWDVYAIAAGHWTFDPQQTLGIRLPGGIPVEELLFFVVVPVAAICSLEAVRTVRGWPVGDERDSSA